MRKEKMKQHPRSRRGREGACGKKNLMDLQPGRRKMQKSKNMGQSKANTNKRKPVFPGIMITRILFIPAFVHSCLNPLFVQFWFMEH